MRGRGGERGEKKEGRGERVKACSKRLFTQLGEGSAGRGKENAAMMAAEMRGGEKKEDEKEGGGRTLAKQRSGKGKGGGWIPKGEKKGRTVGLYLPRRGISGKGRD